MKTAVIYARYSSENQTEQSIEGQLRVCKQYAKNNDVLILDTYIDRAMTGTNDLRPSFQKMIKDSAKRQWDYVLVYKLDRFSRNKYESTIHKKTLKDNGVKLLSAMENIPDTPEGIILESLLEGMNQYYSAELSQKVKRGLRESWIKGNFTGGRVPYGYDVVNKKYIINDAEAAIIRELFTKCSQGYTVTSISKDFHMRGIRNKQGKYFDLKNLYSILLNQKYTGKVEYGGQVYTNIFPPIISESLWKKVNDVHQENRHSPSRKKDIFDFILTGKLVCGDCKRMMVGESGTSQSGTIYYYYSCLSRRRKKAVCSLKSINKQLLEDIVIKTTLNLLSNQEMVHYIAKCIFELHQKKSTKNSVLKSLQAQKNAAVKATNNLIKAIEEGIITEQTKIRLKELETQISSLDFDIEQEKLRSYTYLSVDIIEKYLNSLMSGRTDNIKIRKTLVNTFIREVILFPDKVIITYNFSDQLDYYKITSESAEKVIKQSKKAALSNKNSSSNFNLALPSSEFFLPNFFYFAVVVYCFTNRQADSQSPLPSSEFFVPNFFFFVVAVVYCFTNKQADSQSPLPSALTFVKALFFILRLSSTVLQTDKPIHSLPCQDVSIFVFFFKSKEPINHTCLIISFNPSRKSRYLCL